METIDPAKGVSLGCYLDEKRGTGITLWCLSCGHSQHFDMGAVVKRLNTRGIDGRKVGIRELPRFLTKPCPECGGTKLESRPRFDHGAMGLSREDKA